MDLKISVFRILGWILIQWAIEYNRKEESQLKFLSKDWLIVQAISTVSIFLFSSFPK